jgi:membrane-associated protein
MTLFATLFALLPNWLDPKYILEQSGGWAEVVLFLIIFAECGLLVGFFLPGDSLLFLAGFFSAQGLLWHWYYLLPCLFVAAFAGDQLGYQIGRKLGPALFNRPDSKLFKQANVIKAHEYFERRGYAAIIIGRFVPVVRTFLPVVVGVSAYEYRKFLPANAIGALLWAVGVTSLGIIVQKVVGKAIDIDKYLLPVVAVIVVLSVVPVALEILKARRESV